MLSGPLPPTEQFLGDVADRLLDRLLNGLLLLLSGLGRLRLERLRRFGLGRDDETADARSRRRGAAPRLIAARLRSGRAACSAAERLATWEALTSGGRGPALGRRRRRSRRCSRRQGRGRSADRRSDRRRGLRRRRDGRHRRSGRGRRRWRCGRPGCGGEDRRFRGRRRRWRSRCGNRRRSFSSWCGRLGNRSRRCGRSRAFDQGRRRCHRRRDGTD